MFNTAILLAAGRGERFKSRTAKPLIKLSNRPAIAYSLKALNGHPKIKEIIVVVNRLNCSGILRQIRKYKFSKVNKVVIGGKRRQDSLGSALKVLDKRAQIVLIHDAARPFLNRKVITDCLNEARRSGAAVAGVPVKATIKQAIGLKVKKTLDRSDLWEIQTPQVFRKDLILKAYNKFVRTDVTDDASLVEKMGRTVKIVSGSYFNIKITTPEDLVLAEAIAAKINDI
ncbi:MAG: 2-C-methyl-D-erythritol 4-phosphate cytidylyltransferase [Candidatus Omnitrophica bacterium]|nr:2-C-methyl-D-erythritol 4-phosphate cytidylyltransferase [Candidatus Omnitrophota bacterium]